MRGSLRAGRRPSSCRLLPLSGGKASQDRRVAHSRAKTAPDLAPCGVLPFDYLRKVQVMSANKDKSKKRGQSNKLPFVLMGGHICVDAALGGSFGAAVSGDSIRVLVHRDNGAGFGVEHRVGGHPALFGLMGDKKARPWLMSVGVALAGWASRWWACCSRIGWWFGGNGFGGRQCHAAPGRSALGIPRRRRRQSYEHVDFLRRRPNRLLSRAHHRRRRR